MSTAESRRYGDAHWVGVAAASRPIHSNNWPLWFEAYVTGYHPKHEVLVIRMTPLASTRAHVTRSAAPAQRGRTKRHELVPELGRPDEDEERNSEMRQDPPTDRAVRHQPDVLPEGKPWIAKNSRE